MLKARAHCLQTGANPILFSAFWATAGIHIPGPHFSPRIYITDPKLRCYVRFRRSETRKLRAQKPSE